MPRPVAIVTQAGSYVGPALSRELATRGFDLVLHPGPAELVAELEALRAQVRVCAEPLPLAGGGWQALVDTALEGFGRIDSVALAPAVPRGRSFIGGRFLDAELGELHDLCGHLEATFEALQALLPPMIEQRSGQILVFTSDVGVRPAVGWSLYGGVRAGQSTMIRSIALEHARDGVCLNVLGSKNALYPGFPGIPTDAVTEEGIELGDWSAAMVAETPLGRVATMQELAAFAASLLDGRSRYQTAQYFSFSGGWNQGLLEP